MLSGEIALCSQLIEVDLHVVLEKPGLFETTATDLAAVFERVLVFPHVALEEPGLAEGLTAHLAGEFTDRLPLVAGPRGLFLSVTCLRSYVGRLNMSDELLFVRGGEVAQGALVGFV